MDFLEKLERRVERQQRLKTRRKVLDLIKAILSGKFYSGRNNSETLFNQKPSRPEYISPADRGTYNSGYMEGKEMVGIPNVSENLRV